MRKDQQWVAQTLSTRQFWERRTWEVFRKANTGLGLEEWVELRSFDLGEFTFSCKLEELVAEREWKWGLEALVSLFSALTQHELWYTTEHWFPDGREEARNICFAWLPVLLDESWKNALKMVKCDTEVIIKSLNLEKEDPRRFPTWDCNYITCMILCCGRGADSPGKVISQC